VDDIKFVINYDYPNCSEDYVHRIGRTGRRTNRGTAYTFFTRGNAKQANELIGVLREANQVINPRLYEIADLGARSGGGNRNRRWGFVPKDGMGGGFGGKRKFDGDSNGYPANKRFHGSSSYGNGSSWTGGSSR